MESNIKTFAKEPIGIHGGELPKFADSPETAKYWELHNGASEKRQAYTSEKKRHASKTHNSRGQPIYQSVNSLRTNAILHKNDEIAKKVTEMDFFRQEMPINKTNYKAKVKWTSKLQPFLVKPKSSTKKKYKKPIAEKEEPLYSSFNKNGIFVDPIASLQT